MHRRQERASERKRESATAAGVQRKITKFALQTPIVAESSHLSTTSIHHRPIVTEMAS